MQPDQRQESEEAAKAVCFLAIKADIFIGIPLLAAVAAALAIILR